jgi:hypothetical protein
VGVAGGACARGRGRPREGGQRKGGRLRRIKHLPLLPFQVNFLDNDIWHQSNFATGTNNFCTVFAGSKLKFHSREYQRINTGTYVFVFRGEDLRARFLLPVKFS